ncbi:hypothetical protein [Acanthopleuribacter pedis]|uniref:Transmembrane protein n=1 Tax=Acanthopleuribacter pedis TaxID=442870 RepID=A0A8J7QDS1_9BACT|nr:hypothetical protein [Acanthopleuribacter pedis]MBO1317765.1 hypothetical protein [Acanthopleuribacter pedis]
MAFRIGLTLLVLLLLACGAPAPVVYEKDGFALAHAASWQVTDDAHVGQMRQINIEGPNDAVLLLQHMPNETVLPLTEYAVFYSGLFAESLADLTVEADGINEMERPMRGGPVAGIRETFFISNETHRVPYFREFLFFEKGDHTLVVILQGRQMDETHLQPEFTRLVNSVVIP